MADLLLGSGAVDVVNPALPVITITTPPVVSLVSVTPPSPVVEVASPTLPTFVTTSPPAEPGVVVLPVTGPRGPSGEHYTHTQVTPAATWVVSHGLGRRPAVVVLVAGEVTWPEISYTDLDTVSLEFPTPAVGLADM